MVTIDTLLVSYIALLGCLSFVILKLHSCLVLSARMCKLCIEPQAVDHVEFLSLPRAPPMLPDIQARIFTDDTDGISESQKIVGQRLLDRILILTQTSVPFAAGDDK